MGIVDEARKLAERLRARTQQSSFAKFLQTPVQVSKPIARVATQFAQATPGRVVSQGLLQNQPLQKFAQAGLRVGNQINTNPQQFNVFNAGLTGRYQSPEPVKQFIGQGLQSSSFGLMKSRVPEPTTTAGKVGKFAGGVVGSIPSFSLGTSVLGGTARNIGNLGRVGRTALDLGVGATSMALTQQGNLKERATTFKQNIKDPLSIAMSVALPFGANAVVQGEKKQIAKKVGEALKKELDTFNIPKIDLAEKPKWNMKVKTVYDQVQEPLFEMKGKLSDLQAGIIGRIKDTYDKTGKIEINDELDMMKIFKDKIKGVKHDRFTPENALEELWQHAKTQQTTFASDVPTPKLSVEPSSSVEGGGTRADFLKKEIKNRQDLIDKSPGTGTSKLWKRDVRYMQEELDSLSPSPQLGGKVGGEVPLKQEAKLTQLEPEKPGTLPVSQTPPSQNIQTTLPASSEPIIPKGTERGFISTVKEAKTTAPEIKNVEGYYAPVKNKESVRQASISVDTEGWDAVKQRVMSSPLTAQTNTEGLELMRRAQDAGRYDEAIEIAETLAKKGTEAGQAIQSFSIWGRMTPEGMLKYAQKVVMNAKENMGEATKFLKKVTGKDVDIELSSKEAEQIVSLMKQANAAADETKRMEFTKQALEIINNKIPYGISDYIDEYRYNNMLSGPRTHLRNLYQNALNTLFTRPATMLAEGKFTETGKYYQGLWNGLKPATDDAIKAFRGITEIKSPDLKQLKPGRLPITMSWPTRVLEANDKFFTGLIKSGMENAGATKEQAEKIAEYTLLRQGLKPEGQGYLLNGIDSVTSWLNKSPKAVRWFVPFIRTPMNQVKQWIEYSPVGALTTLGAGNKREQLAKSMVGSVATVYGAMLAAQDKTTWAAPTDQKEKELFYASGRKPFSVLIGDKWVPMWYFGPMAFAVALPAAVKENQDRTNTALTDTQIEKLTQTTSDLMNFVMSQSSLAGLNNFAKTAQGDIDYSISKNLAFTASQTLPFSGLLRYISTIVDPIYRKPSGFKEQIMSGIPGMTFNMESYKDPSGEPSRRDPLNYVLPYDLGTAKLKYNEPYQIRGQIRQQSKLKSTIETGAEKLTYQELKQKFPRESTYYAAEKIYSEIEKIDKKDVAGRQAKLKEFADRGYGDPAVIKAIGKIKELEKLGMAKSDRELVLFTPEVRAQKIIERFAGISDAGKKNKLLSLYRQYGIINKEVEDAIRRLK